MARYGFFIGINDYADPNIGALKCAEDDAHALAGVFEHKLHYVTTLIKNLDRSGILGRLENLESKLRPGDTFVFYFSGHGVQRGEDQYFLLPKAKLTHLDNGEFSDTLPYSTLIKRTMSAAWAGVNRIFMFDACRAELGSKKAGGVLPSFQGEAILRKPVLASGAKKETEKNFPRTIINSCSNGQYAVELIEPGAESGRGAFTAALLDEVEEALDAGGALEISQQSLARIGLRIRKRTEALGYGDHEQSPMLDGQHPIALFTPQVKVITGSSDLDERTWKVARFKNTIEAYEAHLNDDRFECAHVDEALERMAAIKLASSPEVQAEQALWQASQSTHSIASYQHYLEASILKQHAAEAKSALDTLLDNAAWISAQTADSEEGYSQYLASQPQGAYREQTQTALSELEDEQKLWQAAQQADSIPAYQLYAQKTRLKRHLEDSQKQIARIEAERVAEIIAKDQETARQQGEEQSLWGKAQATNTLAAYQHYLSNSTLKLHKTDAERLIGELQQAEALAAQLAQARQQNTEAAWRSVLDASPPKSVVTEEAQQAIARLADDAAWQHASKAAKEEDLRNYLKTYPQGVHASDARLQLAKQEDEANWQKAQTANDEKAYALYLGRQSSGQYRAKAEAAITELKREQSLWQTAQQTNTIAAYHTYQKETQLKHHIEQSGTRIKQLEAEQAKQQTEEETLWQQACSQHDSNSYLGYLAKTVLHIYDSQAQAKMAEVQEAKAYLQAKGEAGYRQFLQRYPQGKHATEAAAKLAELEAANQENALWQFACRQNTRRAYDNYLKNSEFKAYREEAIQRREALPKPKWPWMVGIPVVIVLALPFAVSKKQEYPDPVPKPAPTATPALAARYAPLSVFQDALAGGGQSPEMVVLPGKSFAMGKYEVTVGEYLACVNAGGCPEPVWREVGSPYHYQTGASDHYRLLGSALTGERNPIVGVSWSNANSYAQWLSQKTGHTYHLPTEAEWQYACLADQNTEYCGGNNVDSVGWHAFNHDDRDNHIHPVGQKAANAWGLYDMSGNVWELAEDWYNSAQKYHVLRGGSWRNDQQGLRAALRDTAAPDANDQTIGFRIAMVLP